MSRHQFHKVHQRSYSLPAIVIQMGSTPKANGYHPVPNGQANTAHATGFQDTWLYPKLLLFLPVLKSAIPILLFLFFYSINNMTHFLPRLEDIGCVHIYTIDNIEKSILGFQPHEVLSQHHHLILDFLSTAPYLIHYTIPIVFPLYHGVIKGNLENVTRFYWLMGWVMWGHFFIWSVFPHAPPWVIDHIEKSANGTTLVTTTMSHREGCAFTRIDKFTGNNFFFNMFSGNPVPYGSFPSGHVSWAYIMFIVGGANGYLLYVAMVIWATLYTCHHYVLDAIGALLIVSLTNKIINYLAQKQVCSADFKCQPAVLGCPYQV